MGKKTARGRGHQGGRKPPKGARRFKGGRVAPRAEQLHFPDDVQAVVCELLCDLRLPTTTDTLARRKLEKYKKEPRKVLKALEARRRGARHEAFGVAPPTPPPVRKEGRVRLNLAAETVNCKSGKRSRGAARLLVVDRADDVTKLLAKAKTLLKTKRAPRVAYVADTGLELRDTRGVEDGTLVCVSDDAPAPEPPNAPEQALELGSPAAWDGLALTATPREEAVAPPREEAVAPSPSPAENRGAAPVRIDAGRKAAMDAIRERLPAHAFRARILDAVRANRVVVVAGATGCGKSTQIPQFLLEDAAARVVVTQPRRVAAVSLAERVHGERAERVALGEGSVGYSVRLDVRRSAATRLEFVTVGVLLRRLQRPDGLADVTHVVVDEAHERDVLTDFLLVALKTKTLPTTSVKLLVMSATLDAGLFASYFGGAAAVEIPGRLHPVQHRFADACARRVAEAATGSRRAQDAWRRLGAARLPAAGDDGLTPLVDGPLDVDAVAALVAAIHETDADASNAILCFVPGAAEVDKLCRAVARDLRRATVVPLHGSLPPRDQRRAFQRPPKDSRKVVVSTNVAETSITIDDVVHVVDTGRAREIRYNAASGVASLSEVRVARAATTQRAGRAGRVKPGTCWHAYPEADLGVLPAHAAPEMLRTPLQDLVLQVLKLGLGGPRQFLGAAPQPPPTRAVDAALDDLLAIGCVARVGGEEVADDDDESSSDDDENPHGDDGELFSFSSAMLAESSHDEEDDEEDAPIEDDRWLLTPLGEHVASLPVDCRVGKLLIYGCVFGCADACLTAAAGMSLARGLWRAPPQLRREASLAKKRLAQGDGSDLLAAVRAHEAASALDAEARRRFCRDNFVDERALQELGGLRRQFRSHLVDAGLLDADAPRRPLADALALVRGLLVAGLNPHVARKDREAPDASLRCKGNQRWWVHPQSVNFELLGGRGDARKPRYVVYNARLKTSKPYLLDTSLASPAALCLFGGSLRRTLKGTYLVLDGWLPFKATDHAQLALLALRREVDALVLATVAGHASRSSLAPTAKAVRDVLALLASADM